MSNSKTQMSNTNLNTLEQFLDSYLNFDKKLDTAKIDPYMTNGLMVQGKEEIKKVGFGVSASISLFEKAQKEKCDCIIVHHSFNYPPHNRFDFIFQNRIKYLLSQNISLFGYHFLLDAHPQIGNNVEILRTIGAHTTTPYQHRGNPWGWIGEFESERAFDYILKEIKPFLSQRKFVYNYGREKIKRVAAVSGKGAPFPGDLQELIDRKVDLFITGEVHEWNRELFKEAKISLIGGGHYATEKFGLKALMQKVKDHFNEIETTWLEVLNEI